MKTLFKLLPSVALVFALGAGLTGCLSDATREEALQFKNAGMVAEIPSVAFYGIEDSKGLPIQTAPTSVTFSVNLASPELPTQDVTFTLVVDQAALDAYNKADSTRAFKLLPSNLYQIPSLTVTVKAGQRLAPVTVNFFSSSALVADPGAYNDAQYVLPLTIKSVSPAMVTISGNYATKLILLKIKNKYDGAYKSTGTFTHPVNGPRAIKEDKTLSTVDLQTVETNFADLGPDWKMRLRVNADNTVTLTPTGAANKSTQQTGVNTYDPATRTYTLNYFYPGGGGNRVITETLTFDK